MSLAILFHFLCAQHVSDINISITRSLRLFCWITALVVMFLVRCVLEIRCGWVGVVCVLQGEARFTPTQPHRISNTQRTKNITTNVVIQQHSRNFLVMDILLSEACWAHKKWNKIASDMKFVFYASNYQSWKISVLLLVIQLLVVIYLVVVFGSLFTTICLCDYFPSFAGTTIL